MTDDRAVSPVARLFVGIALPADVQAALGQVQAQLATALPRGVAWVRPESMHLTVKFLGNVPRARLPMIVAALGPVAAASRAFQLWTGPLGVFPTPGRPRVLWVGVVGAAASPPAAPTEVVPPPLADLQARIEAALGAHGFAPETRPFRGHITLGRIRAEASQADLRQLGVVAPRVTVPVLPIPVDELVLFESELARTGARYTPRARLPFPR
jgi:2'-5' RNA ligase